MVGIVIRIIVVVPIVVWVDVEVSVSVAIPVEISVFVSEMVAESVAQLVSHAGTGASSTDTPAIHVSGGTYGAPGTAGFRIRSLRRRISSAFGSLSLHLLHHSALHHILGCGHLLHHLTVHLGHCTRTVGSSSHRREFTSLPAVQHLCGAFSGRHTNGPQLLNLFCSQMKRFPRTKDCLGIKHIYSCVHHDLPSHLFSSRFARCHLSGWPLSGKSRSALGAFGGPTGTDLRVLWTMILIRRCRPTWLAGPLCIRTRQKANRGGRQNNGQNKTFHDRVSFLL